MLYKLDLLNFIKFFWPTEYFFIKKRQKAEQKKWPKIRRNYTWMKLQGNKTAEKEK